MRVLRRVSAAFAKNGIDRARSELFVNIYSVYSNNDTKPIRATTMTAAATNDRTVRRGAFSRRASISILAAWLALSLAMNVVEANDKRKSACDAEPAANGLCRGSFPAFSYFPDTDECKEFTYGGCGGNDNRFPSREICERVCKKRLILSV